MDSPGEPAPGTTDARAEPAAPSGPDAPPPGPDAPPPGLAEQVRRTVNAARRLATTHVALARTELSEILERAKAAAIFVGLAIALLLFAAILASVGTTLFVGEWLFGSLGWGVLHGVLLCVALVAALLLAALEIPGRHLAATFVAAVGIGIVVAVVLGLAWPNQAFTRIGDALIPGIETGVRPLVAGLAVGALLVGLVALVVGARAGEQRNESDQQRTHGQAGDQRPDPCLDAGQQRIADTRECLVRPGEAEHDRDDDPDPHRPDERGG